MGENSKIEWTHHTFNPWRGCTKVSAGCDNCYAEKMSGRNPKTLGVWGKHGTRVVASDAMWREPLKWNAAALQAGERHRVFCASLADVFEGNETLPDNTYHAISAARRRLWALIESTPNLDWLLLTKRPQNVIGKVPIIWVEDGCSMPDHVWLGTSVEDQKTADERIPHLLQIPAKVRFLSIEPLLGPVGLTSLTDREIPPNLDDCLQGHNAIDWVIVGGESGPNARPMHADWVRSIRDQCVEAGVPFLFKQWGEWLPFNQITTEMARYENRNWPNLTHANHYFDDGSTSYRLGKKLAGRLLDGREWNELPEATR